MTNTFYLVWAALFGLVFGSFANVLILRDRARKTILNDRSRCVHCHKVLAWYDLVPVLSYLSLAGRCRYCKKPISAQYPLVELISAGLAVLATNYALQVGSLGLAVGLYVSLLLFLVGAVIDLRTMELPTDYVVAAAIIGGFNMLLFSRLSFLSVMEGLLIGAGSILLVITVWQWLFQEDGMGEGDIWLAGATGLVVGSPLILVSLMSAVLTGAIGGIITMGVSKKSLKTAIPFGPFLFLGLIITLLWGQAIWKWYTFGL